MKTQITKTFKETTDPATGDVVYYGVIIETKPKEQSRYRAGNYRKLKCMALNDAEILLDQLKKEGRIK